MRADDVRRSFLSFFEERGHRVVPSSSLIPTDPTMLLTTAGMVQFKPYFLGQQEPPYPRATSVQKCFRATDIEQVGNTARHQTFFEMLGNFSFGDYFKEGACRHAWELLTERFKIDPDRLWVSVFETDDEAAVIWRDAVGVPEGRIVRFGKEDNFWQMGVPGPCGPCSEIFVDRGDAYGPASDRGPVDGPEDRYPEIWNLVFMQYVQDEPYHVVGDLEQTGIDTGMGLERLTTVLQDVPSNFDTDLFTPIVARAEEITGARRDADFAQTRLLRILADHARAVSFLIADGVVPSNEGRGYVLRRILRRAVTKARLAGVTQPMLGSLCEVVVERFGDAYPELARNGQAVLDVAGREEARFARTLDAGLELLTSEIAASTGALSGEVAFRLHDTYGFPLEITRDVAADAGLNVDEAEFERLMTEQRTRSRRVTEEEKHLTAQLRVDAPPTDFLGYDALEAEGEVLAILHGAQPVAAAGQGEEVDLVLARTPFYPEGGGQVGDRGWIEGPDGRAEVSDTQSQGGIVLHRAKVASGEIHVGDGVRAVVGTEFRDGSQQAHTATHMLHHTLRALVGEHVRQMGSHVEPGRLTFDFSHYEGVPRDVLDEVEETVNEAVLADDEVRWFETSYQQAVHDLGAIAFFEEKYGDSVRVVQIGDYSKELCGGTHVRHTGNVGLVKVVAERSIGANLRRVEALTGIEGLRYVNRRLREMERAAELARVAPEEIADGVDRLLRTQRDLQKALEEQQRRQAGSAVDDLLAEARQLGQTRLVVARRTEDLKTLQLLAVSLRDKMARGLVVLGTAGEGRANLVGAASKALVSEGVDARAILKAAAGLIGGGAGGKPDLATAGGGKPEGLDEALRVAAGEAERLLS